MFMLDTLLILITHTNAHYCIPTRNHNEYKQLGEKMNKQHTYTYKTFLPAKFVRKITRVQHTKNHHSFVSHWRSET